MTNFSRPNKNSFETVVKIITGLFLLLFAYKLYRLFFIHNKLNDYLFSENLLHFEGGYIRRSLLGNLFIAFPEPYWKLSVMVLYSGMIIVLLIYVLRHYKNIYALLLFLSAPFGIRMVMFDFGSMYRKEFIFYMLIILVIAMFRTSKNQILNLVYAVSLSTVMIMVHESFIFLAMPVIAWIFYINNAGMTKVIVYVALCCIAFLFLSGAPSDNQIQALDQFFAVRKIDWSKTRLYMTFSKSETLNMAISHLFKGSIFFYLIFFLPVVLYLFYMRMIDRRLMILLAIQLIFCSVVCIIAIDYGRWLSFLLVSFFICMFVYGNLDEFAVRIRNSVKEKFLYVLILAFMMSVYLPHYIQNYNFTENIVEYSFLEKISYSFSELAKENQ
jgi:hypothetical protein